MGLLPLNLAAGPDLYRLGAIRLSDRLTGPWIRWNAITEAWDRLLAKPLRLPHLQGGADCPATPVSDVPVPLASPRGGRTFYLGGSTPRGGYAFNKMGYALVAAEGPVLRRGARIDSSGSLKFAGPPADPALPGEVLSSGDVTRTLYAAVLSQGAVQAGGYIADALYVYPATAGCYAVQADGSSFEAVIIFVVTT
jgi:hypothetical protein